MTTLAPMGSMETDRLRRSAVAIDDLRRLADATVNADEAGEDDILEVVARLREDLLAQTTSDATSADALAPVCGRIERRIALLEHALGAGRRDRAAADGGHAIRVARALYGLEALAGALLEIECAHAAATDGWQRALAGSRAASPERG